MNNEFVEKILKFAKENNYDLVEIDGDRREEMVQITLRPIIKVKA